MGSPSGRKAWWRRSLGLAVPVGLFLLLGVLGTAHVEAGGGSVVGEPPAAFLSLSVIGVSLCLLSLSAFFSGSETAFLSIQRHRIRTMRDETRLTSRLVVNMLDHPGHMLTTILVGNMIVNTIIGVVLGTRLKDLFALRYGMSTVTAYCLAVTLCTALLLVFGEITPKVFAVRAGESLAHAVVIPLRMVSRLLGPVCGALLAITRLLFRVSRLQELRAAPYVTDEEIKAVLSNGSSRDPVEEKGREMIRRILEFRDVMLREILVPRPDVIALPEDATVEEARALFREHGFSRIPVFHEDLDHIQGALYAKDLLPSLAKGDMARPIKNLLRKAYYVPETMSVQEFVKQAQRLRTHLAIVVDEYGGTEGIVTLDDAMEEVVGDIQDEHEHEEAGYSPLGEGVYRLDGSLPLDALAELTGFAIEDDEHETLAGFLMSQIDKVLEEGDEIPFGGVHFIVETVDGKRASTVRMERVAPSAPDALDGGAAT
ncbi:MAG TPA: hemolysin family protein [Candidatus Hydrogenedentes bacterium]|nr:hemolysin family protein [Candidatus Hydrogenedentota bacterium]HPG65612.1 hemolysin family protein [Candidatus Hydrogenedentota bacterium]